MEKLSSNQQSLVIIKKNHIIAKRTNEYLKEAIVPAICMIFYIVCYMFRDNQSVTAVLGSYLSIVGPMSIIPFLRGFLYNIVNEKSEKYKETYKIMGMQQTAYTLSWLYTIVFKGLIIAILICSTAALTGAYDQQGVLQGIGIFLLYTSASIAFVFMFSTMFNKAKMATEVYILFSILTIFLYYLIYINYVNEHIIFFYIICLFPPAALNLFTFINNGPNMPNPINNLNPQFNQTVVFSMLAFDTFIFFMLYLYLDEVFPNEYGTQKKWNFQCTFCLKKNKKQNSSQSELQQINQPLMNNNNNDNFYSSNDFSSAKFHENFKNTQNLRQTIKIQNLKKQFGDLKAVNDVSLCLYERQIFCLLGHNGAGKTTTISLLTGMLPNSGGDVSIYDYDLNTDLDQIRSQTGICNQKDVLFDHLTVEEHLKYICDLKGYKDQNQISQLIEHNIEKCNLTTEKNKYSKHLSGGNKRKLSLAVALIAGSKVVFLDEPSSGMDPNTRRMIWDILKEVKNENRTIVLTTHHLEEAEELAERIGIMAKGQLLTVGTSNFIKKKFGIGYHLKISQISEKQELNVKNLNPNQQEILYVDFSEKERQDIIQQVTDIIPESKYNPQSHKDTIVFTLSFESVDKFSELFQQLEQNPAIKVNLELNTLEDAFINIGMDEDKFLNDEERQEFVEQDPKIDNQKEKYTDFNDIMIPDILKQPPVYSATVQIQAMFLRKYYAIRRTRSMVFAFIMPLIFLTVGAGICFAFQQAINDQLDDEQQQDDNTKAIMYLSQAILMSMFLVLGYTSSNASYCSYLVMEKEQKLKYVLNVMGCRSSSYWLGNFFFDYVVFLLIQVIYVIIMFSFQISFFVDNLLFNILVMMSFGVSYINFAYLQTFIYEKQLSAQRFSQLLNFYVFYLIFLLTMLFGSKIVNTIVMCLAPYYLLFWALFTFTYNFINQTMQPGQDEDITNQNYINQPYMYCLIFIIQGIVYMLWAFRLDNTTHKLGDSNEVNQNEIQENQYLEADIVEEERRVNSKDCQDLVKIKNLYKKYDNGYLAIKNNNFGVDSGQIFGLLGPNGAGKSTTFNILTSFISKTKGSVQMKDIEVNKGIMDIYQNVGICAQFDALWEFLTVKEHLALFGRMKGLKNKDLDDSVDYFIKVMQLDAYINVQSSKLSGGNKRKLCVSIALIGGPDMQFCDEPSSGVDPIARRFLWNTLQNSLKLRNSSITITTHSMNEAESLCSKIGILINGKFQCIGSPQYLKQKYGDGYLVSIQTYNPKKTAELVKQQYPQAEITNMPVETDQNTVTIPINQTQELDEIHNIYLKLPYQGFSFSQTFQYFQQNLVQNQIIKDFSVQQSSLESIFLQFSKMQKVIEENENFEEPTGFLCFKKTKKKTN